MDQLPSTAVQTGLLEGRQGGREIKDVPSGPSPSFPSPAQERGSWKDLSQRKGTWEKEDSSLQLTLKKKSFNSLVGSPPPQHPELGGAGWARSAGSRVLSSDCRPTGNPATRREGDQELSNKGAAHTSIPGRDA